jgi:hypothetical protein
LLLLCGCLFKLLTFLRTWQLSILKTFCNHEFRNTLLLYNLINRPGKMTRPQQYII